MKTKLKAKVFLQFAVVLCALLPFVTPQAWSPEREWGAIAWLLACINSLQIGWLKDKMS